MPLLLMTGLPASGKTTIVSQIVANLRKRVPSNCKIHVVSDDDLSTFSRASTYEHAGSEKELRSYLRSSVQAALDQTSLVILDSLNYIKGYRYEIFCIAKACKTTYCVLYANVGDEANIVKTINEQKPNPDHRYSDATLDALVMRYEPPNGKNRWDSPLIEIPVSMNHSSPSAAGEPAADTNLILPDYSAFADMVYECLFEGRQLEPNFSTQCQPLAPTNFLHEIDQLTQEIVRAVLGAQSENLADSVPVPHTDVRVDLAGRPWTMPEMTRLRRQFLNYLKSRLNPGETLASVATMFVNFMNTSRDDS